MERLAGAEMRVPVLQARQVVALAVRLELPPSLPPSVALDPCPTVTRFRAQWSAGGQVLPVLPVARGRWFPP
jgi:hypothetical protein